MSVCEALLVRVLGVGGCERVGARSRLLLGVGDNSAFGDRGDCMLRLRLRAVLRRRMLTWGERGGDACSAVADRRR